MVSVSRATSTVSVAWNPSTDPTVAGYRVYSGTSSGVYTQETDAGNATSATLTGFNAGQTYFFAVTAYNSSGLESAPSNEISAQTPSLTLSGIGNGMAFNASSPITLSAIASESGGSITSVTFFQNATEIGSSSAAPYSFVWNGAPAGVDVVTVVATDANGITTSTQFSVNVVPFGITGTQFMPDGSFQLSITGALGKTNSVYYSTDLQNWTLLSTAVNVTGTLLANDPAAPGSAQRFYKVTSN